MFEGIANSSSFTQSLIVMLFGISGVFIVLILFFLLIVALMKIFPEKEANNNGK